jgi:hypothetical protein
MYFTYYVDSGRTSIVQIIALNLREPAKEKKTPDPCESGATVCQVLFLSRLILSRQARI